MWEGRFIEALKSCRETMEMSKTEAKRINYEYDLERSSLEALKSIGMVWAAELLLADPGPTPPRGCDADARRADGRARNARRGREIAEWDWLVLCVTAAPT